METNVDYTELSRAIVLGASALGAGTAMIAGLLILV